MKAEQTSRSLAEQHPSLLLLGSGARGTRHLSHKGTVVCMCVCFFEKGQQQLAAEGGMSHAYVLQTYRPKR